jgi:MFS family permease
MTKTQLKQQTKKALKIIYLMVLILALTTALPLYIQSNFLEQFVSMSFVSLFFVIANIATFLSILLFPRWVKKLSNYFLAIVITVLGIISLAALAFVNQIALVLLFFTISTVVSALIWINMDLFLEAFSDNANTGKIRTIFLTFLNIGWIMAPMLSSYLVNVGGYGLTYLIAAIVLIPFLMILIKNKERINKKVEFDKLDLHGTFIGMWKNVNIRGIFAISFLYKVYGSALVIYIPIYLHHTIGLDWAVLGIIFSVMLTPFLLIELPAGVLADKLWGEKEMLTFGFFVIISSLLLFFFTTSTSVLVWALLLFLSRVGSAFLESMSETYFFKIVDIENLNTINMFRTTSPLGYLVGSIIGAVISFTLPVQYVFLFLAILMLSGFYYIYIIKDTK